MTHPTEQAREIAKQLSLYDYHEDAVKLIAHALQTARDEERERCAKIAESFCDQAYHGEHCENDCAASRIRAQAQGPTCPHCSGGYGTTTYCSLCQRTTKPAPAVPPLPDPPCSVHPKHDEPKDDGGGEK